MVTYSLHAGPSLSRVNEILKDMGEPLPNPKLSVAWVAEDENGQVLGVLVLQSIPFVEPCVGENAEVVRGLFAEAEKFIKESGTPRVMMHTSNRGMQVMLTRKGAKMQPDPLFDWRSA